MRRNTKALWHPLVRAGSGWNPDARKLEQLHTPERQEAAPTEQHIQQCCELATYLAASWHAKWPGGDGWPDHDRVAGQSGPIRCSQRSVHGGLNVESGCGEDRNWAVRSVDQQLDFGAAEHDALGAGIHQARDDVAVDLS